MSEIDPNKAVLEKIAREVYQAKSQEEVDNFIKTVVYLMLAF